MGELLASPEAWGLLSALITPLLLGLGFLIKRGFAKKDRMVERYEAQIDELGDEVEVLSEKYTARTEEVMELRAHSVYHEKMLQVCEKELKRLRGEV